MPRFIAIDGLRTWMAWLVVASHIVQLGLPQGGGPFWVKLDIGGHAVDTFIIISGFVITHLLTERPGPYVRYIVPRFMRLFPAFVVCWTIGILSYAIAAEWGDATWFQQQLDGGQYSMTMRMLPAHMFAHLTMLHGVLPNNILPLSEYAFLPPGWSVSLEWQFYIVAPFIIWLCRSRTSASVLVACVVLLSLIYHFQLKEYWDRPSILIGTSKLFLVGIGCRLAAPALVGSVRYVTAISLGVGYTSLWMGSPALAIWLILYCFMLKIDRREQGLDRLYVAAMRAIFESRAIQLLADRSYSTYLLHWSVIVLIGVVASSHGIVPGPKLLAFTLLAIPLTLALQEPIYRLIEIPGRALGKRWSLLIGVQKSGV